jgi:hypothetical protein
MSIHPPQQQQRDPHGTMRPEGAGLRYRLLALVLTGAVVLAGCSGGGGSGGGSDDGEAAPAEPPPVAADVGFSIGSVRVESAGPPVELPAPVVEQVTGLVDAYVQRATVDPLMGRDTDGVTELFTPFAAAALEGPDRASLVDEGVGRATKDITAKTATVNLDGLADQAGNVVLVAATVALDVETATDEGPVRIARLGDLVLVPEGFEWKIGGYDLAVERETPTDEGPEASTEVSS